MDVQISTDKICGQYKQNYKLWTKKNLLPRTFRNFLWKINQLLFLQVAFDVDFRLVDLLFHEYINQLLTTYENIIKNSILTVCIYIISSIQFTLTYQQQQQQKSLIYLYSITLRQKLSDIVPKMQTQKYNTHSIRVEFSEQSQYQENAQLLTKLKEILSNLIHEKQTVQKAHAMSLTTLNGFIHEKDELIEKLNEEIKVKDKFIQLMFKENQTLQAKIQSINKMTKSSSVSNLSSSFFKTSPVLIKNYSKPSLYTRESMPSISQNAYVNQFKFKQQKSESTSKRQFFQSRLFNINNYFNDLKQKMQDHLRSINIQKQAWSNPNMQTIKKHNEQRYFKTIQNQSILKQDCSPSSFKTLVKTSRSIYQKEQKRDDKKDSDNKTSIFNNQIGSFCYLGRNNQNNENKMRNTQKQQRKTNQPFFKRRKNVHEIQCINLYNKKQIKNLKKI